MKNIRFAIVPLLFTALLGTAAADEQGPPRKRRGPPPEAIEACRERAVGDACTVRMPDRSIDGTCRARPDGGEGPLACIPEGAPPPPPPPQ